MAAPAIALGVRLKVLAQSIDDPAAQVIPDVTLGDFRNLATLRAFVAGSDVVALDFLDVPMRLLQAIEADGTCLRPSVDSLIAVQDRNLALAPVLSPLLGPALAVHVGRSPHGQAALWAITEVQSENSLGRRTITPMRGMASEVATEAARIALELAGSVELLGVMAVEMVVVGDRIQVTKLRLGPQYSGFWSLDGSQTGVVEQHLRAILDLPLGTTELLAPFAVSAEIVGTDKDDLYHPYLHVFARDPSLKIHQYGTRFGLGNVLGHVTVIGGNASELRIRAAHAADYISGVIDE